MKASRPVFDASAVLALIQVETGCEDLEPLQPDALVSAVNVSEVLARLVNRGMTPREAQASFDSLHLVMTPFEPSMAFQSVQFVRRGVSLGDRCFLAACVHGSGWTSDRSLAAVALLVEGAGPLNFFR